jgi:hypothetical protein
MIKPVRLSRTRSTIEREEECIQGSGGKLLLLLLLLFIYLFILTANGVSPVAEVQDRQITRKTTGNNTHQ